jgi:hypothetical protein
MRLLDQINLAQSFVVDNARLRSTFRVKTAADFRDAIRVTPQRYILDDTATKLCAELAVRDAQFLYKSFDILRAPAERLWIEWRERPRFEALRPLPVDLPDPSVIPNEARAGVLIEAGADGRSGRVWIFTGYKDSADLCPLYLEFSTEASLPPPRRDAYLSKFSVAVPKIPSLKPLMDHCLFSMEPSWSDYCRKASGRYDINRDIEALAGKIWLDWPFIAAFLLLYQARSVLEARPSNLADLNRARAKRGKIDLLEHVEMVASLRPGCAGAPAAAAATPRGKRLHHVRGHLVRRGDKLFWRSPHLRGDRALGVVATRTVRVTA